MKMSTMTCFQMPLLKPETISMTGLNLFTQLCQLAKIANVSVDSPLPEEQVYYSRSTICEFAYVFVCVCVVDL